MPSKYRPKLSALSEFARMGGKELAIRVGLQWPAERWQADPVGFARTILGVELWTAQETILESIRDNKRTTVSGGRKVGKDHTLGVAALWWYASFPEARVFMTATTARQVDVILYRQVRQLYAASGRCADCKLSDPRGPRPCEHSAVLSCKDKPGELARTGIVADDFREIRGATADSEEGMAGLSGRILAIIDEASRYPEHIYRAIVGNLAAEGCREAMISNPTRSRGVFFDSFHGPGASLYNHIQVSSLETPNFLQGRNVIPGLASKEWVEERRQEWGEDSPAWKIHVEGQFVMNEEGVLFPMGALAEAEERWEGTEPDGQLFIGVDSAGDSGEGDETALCARRGNKVLELYGRRGLTPEAHLIEVLGLIANHGDKGAELPVVVVDRDGPTGAKVWGAFLSYVQAHDNVMKLSGFRGGERSERGGGKDYYRNRDALYASCAEWMKDGGAIPSDVKLTRELQAMRWIDPAPGGQARLVHKDDLRTELGRSPDRADALALSCWRPATIGATAVSEARQETPQKDMYATERMFDPYSAERDWRS